ncbi:MAG: choice-of-anchor U domain-containing protein, partial [Solirubrobacteraceae bacterium]
MALGTLAALVLSVALLLLPVARAQATESPVTVGPAEISQALFVAGDVSRLSKVPAGTEDVVLEKALQQLYADESTLAPAIAEGYIDDMKAALVVSSAPSQASLELMGGNQRIIAILATLERPYGEPAVELPPAAKLAVTHLAEVALSSSSDIFASAEVPKYFEPLADARTNLAYTSFAPATVLRATRELAQTDRTFGEARDALWKTASEESVFSQWKELLEESKQVLDSPALKELRETVEKGGGTITKEPTQLTALFTQGQKATQEQSCEHGGGEEEIGGNSITGVPRLKCSGGALYEAAHAPSVCTKNCEEELERRQSRAAKREQAIAEERAEMVAAAELLRPSDNTAATLQQATAQAQAQITEEETAYAAYEAQKAEKEAIAGGVKSGLLAGTGVLAIATGNESEGIAGLIGVGFELYEHTEKELSNPPPGPQEITLQDLADISTQLAGFQEYTQEAFHAINTQLAQLSSQLARENYELKQQLSELGERLVKEQSTIYALQDEVQTLFAAQTKANLQETIEDSVGWLQHTGEPLAASSFQQALVALKKDATEIANGALVNNAETQLYDFEGAFRQLTSKATGEPAQLSEDIGYLARFPGEEGWPSPLAPSSLANTTFWAESSRAYAQLMLENAGHTTAADIAGVKALENEALKLERTEGSWSEASSPGSMTGNAILNEAIAKFERAAYGAGVDGTESVKTLLQEEAEESAEKSLEKNVTPGQANPTSVQLWGGPEQSFSAQAVANAKYAALKWKECGGSEGANGAEEMPAQFIESLPAALVNGVRLGAIGASGSGDPLILEACRTITNAKENKAKVVTKTVSTSVGCPGLIAKTCEVIGNLTTKSETNEEEVAETLTLTEGASKYTLASPNVCKQNAQHWRASLSSFGEDPELGTKNGLYDVTIHDSFTEERHVGTEDYTGLKIEANFEGIKENVGFTPEGSEDPLAIFEGSHCPAEGGEEKPGLEYATYGGGESPLGSGSQLSQATMVAKVDAKLGELQRAAYSQGREALENPPHGNPAESLAGARALVQSYVKLGLPQALGSDVALQSDIEGLGAQFLDPKPGNPGTPRPLPAQLHALIGSWIENLEKASGSSLTQLLEKNPIEEVQARSEAWAKAVAGEVKLYVEGKAKGFSTGPEEKVGEQSALVESTLNRLQLTRDVLAEAKAPTAETLTPGSVGTNEATVRGEVDTNGGVAESCVFEYGATEFYGHSIACSAVPSSSEKAVVVSAKIANWTPEGSFHERVVLKTWGGTSYGEDVKVQLAQSTPAPAGGLVIGSTNTTGATIGTFKAEELPAGSELPAGLKQIIGSLKFTVNVTPGGSARVKIELPAGSAPSALYKLVHVAAGGEEYKEIPTSLYTIKGNVVELTLLDGGPDDEDGEVNGVIVDPLVPVIGTKQSPSPTTTSATSTTAPAATVIPPAGQAAHKAHTSSECVSHRQVTVHVAYHLSLPARAKLLSSKILLRGRVVAKLSGRAKAAVVSFAGLQKGPYK